MTYQHLDLDDVRGDLWDRWLTLRNEQRAAELRHRRNGVPVHAATAATYGQWADRVRAAIEVVERDRRRGWNSERVKPSHPMELGDLLELIEQHR